ncbi:acyl-CoA dehydrogenase family protein [Mycobacterium sp. EPa45]|uniref:acyl-CoA dehydrogenase family protein n=1 Tax=Mycobacterium sp. EPa45 TaxID=1545728 RepID=UPI0006419E18|nr:acyl-CoA dehydrogenase family protein [Mycobacterium sp. EPa45]AKK25470.1 hypothetical protein AB431_00670 [Mycobacterium sp. EPa45]
MDQWDDEAAGAMRAEVRRWLAENWRPPQEVGAFVDRVIDAGWACPNLAPTLFGRGLPLEANEVVIQEFAAADAPLGAVDVTANRLIANVINLFGTDESVSRSTVRGLLSGEHRTCLLYSEPGAGSDLAAVQTRAEPDGDEWVVNGQKVWSSLAAESTLGLLVARTNWDVPKHKGITLFLLPMRQPGVLVRPIRQMTGRATFNEVFLSDARVADTHRIGDLNGGWSVLQTALALERMAMGRGTVHDRDEGSELVRTSIDALITLARERGRNRDREVRQEIARLYALERVAHWNGERAENSTDERAASVVKLAMSELLHDSARLHARLLGAEGLLAGSDSQSADRAHLAAMCAFENSIGGGSDQIQRNLIGERVLGLPREPSLDRDVPFRDVRKSVATWT